MKNKKRLIDVNALIEKAEWYEDYDGCTGEYVCKKHIDIEEVENAPTVDAVEVVRCKDCRYYPNANGVTPYCTNAHGISLPRKDDFCSCGERV